MFLVHFFAQIKTKVSALPLVKSWTTEFLWLMCALLLAPSRLHAQEADDVQPNTPLFLQADKLIGNVSASGFTRELIGNVVLTQGAVRITCNRAMHYVEQNRADLFGNVILTQGATTMKAAQGSYDGASRYLSGTGGVELFDGKSNLKARTGGYSTAIKVARFFGNVRIENDSLIITSDSLEYHRATQNSYATGMVTAIGKFTSAYLHGDSLVNINAEKYTRISNYALHGQAMVSQIDTVLENSDEQKNSQIRTELQKKPSSAKKNTAQSSTAQSSTDATVKILSKTPSKRLDTLCITGNVLEAFRKDSNEVYIATGNVQMTRRQLAGRAERGVYEKTFSRIRLYSVTNATPILWLDSTQLRGDSVIIFLKEKRLDRIIAYTDAFAATKNDTAHQDRIDQLSGENIIIEAQRDTIRAISAEGKAFNLYFAQSETDDGTGKIVKEPDGAVKNAADTVKVLFEAGELDNIIWRGKVEGEYIPESLAQKQLQTLRLKGFEWFENRPQLWRGMTQGVQRSVPGSVPRTNSTNSASKAAASKAAAQSKKSGKTKQTLPQNNKENAIER
jgi:lipopolysaccharide export system protein LptA